MAKRRGNQERSIYKDRDGRRRAAAQVGYKDGKRQRQLPSGGTRAEVAKKLQENEMRAFTPDEARRFLAAIKGHRLEALFSVALSLGLRQGEILGLRWQDIDLEGKGLLVRFQLQRIDGRLQLVEPKTPKSVRTLMLPQVAVSALAAHRARQDQERQLAGTRWVETGMLFTTTIGTMLDPRSLLRAFYAILKTSDLPKVRFHDLRCSAATRLLTPGAHELFNKTPGVQTNEGSRATAG